MPRGHGTVEQSDTRNWTPNKAREITMIMIQKPGKDITKVKGWRPIVLANTIGKLGE